MGVGQNDVKLEDVEKANVQLINPEKVSKEPIDIIMPTHGRLDLTMKCVNSIYANTTSPFHLIVVDDSTPDMDDGIDLTQDYFERLTKKYNNITYIHSPEPYKCGNQFFNIALQHGAAEFVATIMNSMTVEPEWDLVAVQLMKDNPDWGIIGFKCLFPWGQIESAGINMAGFTPFDMGKNLPGHRLTTVYECKVVQWAFALLRRKAVVGNLAEDVFHGFLGWDDIDNCFVVRSKGWKIYYCGMGVGYHEPRVTRGTDTNDIESHILNLENAHAFYKRWGFWDTYKNSPAYRDLDKIKEQYAKNARR